MRANSLLEKGILSRDDAVFKPGMDNIDKIITEFEALQNLVAEYRVLHCFLNVVHSVVIVGIIAHLALVVGYFKTEATLCILVNPSSYFFMLIFSLATVYGSFKAVRHSSKRELSSVFFRKQRKIHLFMMAVVVMMVLSALGGSRLCKIERKQSYWPFIWIIFSFLQAALLISYTKWFNDELKDLGFGEESSENKQETNGNNSTSEGNKSYESEMPSLGTRTRQSSRGGNENLANLSLNSITTV